MQGPQSSGFAVIQLSWILYFLIVPDIFSLQSSSGDTTFFFSDFAIVREMQFNFKTSWNIGGFFFNFMQLKFKMFCLEHIGKGTWLALVVFYVLSTNIVVKQRDTRQFIDILLFCKQINYRELIVPKFIL